VQLGDPEGSAQIDALGGSLVGAVRRQPHTWSMDQAQDPLWAEAAELAADRADRAVAARVLKDTARSIAAKAENVRAGRRPLRPIDALIAELGITREELANGDSDAG
jgi:hypothetical protein